jgi:hypothetical protein
LTGMSDLTRRDPELDLILERHELAHFSNPPTLARRGVRKRLISASVPQPVRGWLGAGVTGRQVCNDFKVSWNVFYAVTGYKGGKSSNRLPCHPTAIRRAETGPTLRWGEFHESGQGLGPGSRLLA